MTGFIIQNPTLEQCLKVVKMGIGARRLLIMLGELRVDYFGRGSSELDYGERLLIVKGDGSLLVHRPTNVEPVNWQPPGSLYRAYVKRGLLVLEAYRKRPEERVRVTFRRVSLVGVYHLKDEAEFKLYTAEEIMKKAFIKRPDLVEKGLRVVMEEKRLRAGLVDCFCVDSSNRPVVVEFKKDRASVEAVEQLSRYVDELRRGNPEVRGILVAPSITRKALERARSLNLEYRRLDVRRCIRVLESIGESVKPLEYFEG